jgi:hypothetical protein
MRLRNQRIAAAVLLLVWAGPLPAGTPPAGSDSLSVMVMRTISGGAPNTLYQGNRTPLLPSPLIPVPVGTIHPRGWLKTQLEDMAEGFTGHLVEISKWCNAKVSAWASRTGEGEYGWEELPYWLRGYADLGYILGNQRIMDESKRWIDSTLASQDSTGWFGPRVNRAHHDIWPNMLMLFVMRSHYEATGDPRIIPFMTRYFQWLSRQPLADILPGSWQKWRGGDNLEHILWLYNQTGDAWLLDAARVNHERTSDWVGGIPTWHGVNLAEGFREPAEYYQVTRDPRYLASTIRDYDSVMSLYGQVPGGLYGADEDCRPGYGGPRQGTETCTMVEMMHSTEMLTHITGDPDWADRCETVAFNMLPASMTPDLKGLHYLTAPNQVQLDTSNKAPMIENDGDMFSYDPWDYRCCQHNVAFGWPYFAENLWMATGGNGLAAVFYAPNIAELKAGNGTAVRVEEKTDYPFRGIVDFNFTTSSPSRFPFVLRVPGWCAHARVEINGTVLNPDAPAGSWIVLTRQWNTGAAVRLVLPMDLSVHVWTKNRNSLSVNRGPLTYSLKIGEKWVKRGGTDQWPGYEVFPTTRWNYGLVIDMDNPARSFHVEERPGSPADQPFDISTAPVTIRAIGKLIPAWKQETNGMVGLLPESPVRSDATAEPITLVPMGCARLRITAFPVIESHPSGPSHH